MVKPEKLLVLVENVDLDVAKQVIANILKTIKFKVEIKKQKCGKYFSKKFDGYYLDLKKIYKNKLHKPLTLIFTNRKLYGFSSETPDQWIFGYCWCSVAAISTKRIATKNKSLLVKRLESLAIHEIAHSYLWSEPKHLKVFTWHPRGGKPEPLGRHCPNKRCVFYEIVDVKSPSLKEGYATIGKRKSRALGIDENMRLSKNKFCRLCLAALKKQRLSWPKIEREIKKNIRENYVKKARSA